MLAIPGDNGTVVLAIRIHVPRVSDDYYENTKVKAEIGSPEMAQWAADLNKEDRLLDFVLSGAVNAAIFDCRGRGLVAVLWAAGPTGISVAGLVSGAAGQLVSRFCPARRMPSCRGSRTIFMRIRLS